MKISLGIEALKSQYRQPPRKRRPLFLRGKPGIAKSDGFKTAAQELAPEYDCEFVDCTHDSRTEFGDGVFAYQWLQATIEDPITLSGLPAREKDHAVFLAFKDKLPTSGRGILEIQEVNTAPPAVQAGLYGLFLHGRLGSYRLPDGWYIGASGNRDEDRAATQRIPMPLIGRWTQLNIELDLADWTKWALANGVRTEVIAFYQFKPELLDTFDPEKREPYSCPRTAVFASDILDSAPPGAELDMLKGTIGDGPGAELTAFMRVWRSMVSVDAILLDPDGSPLPTQPDACCAIGAALAAKATQNNFARVLRYVRRWTGQGLKEYEMLAVTLALKRDSQLCATRAFIDWSAENTDFVL